MLKPSFIAPETNIIPLEEVQGEKSYEQKIQKIEGTDLIIKRLKGFNTVQETLAYISGNPTKRTDNLAKFMPETEYIVGQDPTEKVVYAMVKKFKVQDLIEWT